MHRLQSLRYFLEEIYSCSDFMMFSNLLTTRGEMEEITGKTIQVPILSLPLSSAIFQKSVILSP